MEKFHLLNSGDIMFENTIKVQIIGKNIERFIQRLQKEKIELLQIDYVNYKEIIIKIYKRDYDRILKIKTIYEVKIIELCGINKINLIFKKNLHVLLSIFVSLCFLFLLSNVIFKVEVIHSSKELRELLLMELKKDGLKEKSFVKSYQEIQKIKQEILEKYKDKIEWLEIERSGVKYIVRVEERIISNIEKDKIPADIIASKDAIIKDIDAIQGEVIKNINDYVKKGDTVITGQIKLYDEVKKNIKAEGKVYGEVWYQASIEYPMTYYEEKLTGNEKKRIVISFLNHQFDVTFRSFKTKKVEEISGLKSNWIPFKITLENQKEMIVIDEELTEEEAFEKAVFKVKEKINSNLSGKEKILDVKCLKKEVKNSTIILDLFVSVLEDITDSKTIEIGE